MAHIVDGALAAPVLIAGIAMAAGGVALGLKKLKTERIPLAGLLTAAFFVASLIHVPAGPASAHLVLSGLAGLLLGWAAFPVLFTGLVLQTVFFGFGGITALGVNVVTVALPAVCVGLLLGRFLRDAAPERAALLGAAAGALAIALTAAMVAGALALSGDAFLPAAQFALIAHLPVMMVEAAVTGAALYLAMKVKPEMMLAYRAG